MAGGAGIPDDRAVCERMTLREMCQTGVAASALAASLGSRLPFAFERRTYVADERPCPK